MQTQKLIPGIYNFCDSWCERCLFTNRCHSYLLQQKENSEKPINSAEDLAQHLTDALNLTKKYIDKMRQTTGLDAIDGPTSTEKEAYEKQAIQQRQRSREHPVGRLANKYLERTGNWLNAERNLLKQAGHQQIYAVELGLRTEVDALEQLNVLRDAWEMIKWYRTLIPVKTMSVLRGLEESLIDNNLSDYYLGKVKLVLVSIDRSLLAWQTVMAQFSDKTDELLDLLALLNRLSRELESIFPEARAFKRPGLD